MFLECARHAFLHLTVIKNEYKWHTQDVEFRCQHRTGFNIDFSDPDFAFGICRKFIDNRCESHTGGAPGGPGEKQHRQRGFQHFDVKIAVGYHHRLRLKQFPGLMDGGKYQELIRIE